MARNTAVQLLDDLTGEPAGETVGFALDGIDYDIDLSFPNADGLRALLERYIEAGRRTGGRKQRPRLVPGAKRPKAVAKSRARKADAPAKAATGKSAAKAAPAKTKAAPAKAAAAKKPAANADAAKAAAAPPNRCTTRPRLRRARSCIS